MAEVRINTTGKLSLFDADDSHAASIVAGTVTANENVMSLATAGVTFNVPTITLGDATAEDTKLVFDGNAQDFHIGLDDSADDLIIGLGSTVGTTPMLSFTEAGAATFKNVGTGDDNPMTLTLQTAEIDIAADDVIGAINFQAPDEGTGTDAILVSGAIQAVAEGNHSSSSNATSLQFMTGASEAATAKMHIKSDGKVGIGTDSPTKTLGIGGDGIAALEGSSNALTFYDSAALKAYITSQSFGDHNGDGLGIVTAGDEPIKFFANGALQWTIETTGHLIPGATDHGIYLGVSSATASNLLTDYEEGTFTPTLVGDAGATAYSLQVGRYTKIGRIVTIHIDISMSTIGSYAGAYTQINGLPFTGSNSSSNGQPGAVRVIASATAADHIVARVPQNSAILRIEKSNGTTGTDMNINANHWDTGTSFSLVITYEVE